MKVSVDVEATPQELRSFFGLPNIEPLQEEMLDVVRKNMRMGMEGFDPSSLLKPFLPEQLQSLGAFQKALWLTMTGQGQAVNSKDDKNKKDEKSE